MSAIEEPCPLCGDASVADYHRDARRTYLVCNRCRLVFVPARFRLDAQAEKAEYDRHRNAIEDLGYRRFLSRLAEPLLARLSVPSRGLDFGCGPGPALATIMKERGHNVDVYDPFYAPGREALEKRYQFITMSEVIEHLFSPGRELAMLLDLLEPGGWLGVMTKRVIDQDRFSRWHYKDDPTHVCFFSEHTFNWIARNHGLDMTFHGDDVVLLQKAGPAMR